MVERSAGARADTDGRAAVLRQFEVAGDEVRVEVGFDDPANLEAKFRGAFDINRDIALRVDHGSLARVVHQVRRVGETAEIEPFNLHGLGYLTSYVLGWGTTRRYGFTV